MSRFNRAGSLTPVSREAVVYEPAPSTGGVVDDFEDNSLSEYTVDTQGNWGIQTSIVKEGTYALSCDYNSTNKGAVSSTSGLANYPAQGDTFRVWMRYSANNDYGGIVFGVPTDSTSNQMDGYHVHFHRTGDATDFHLRKYPSGTQLAATGSGTSPDTWYEIEVDWQSTITVRLLDAAGSELASMSANDTTYTSGGIGFFGNHIGGNGIFYWDNWRIL